MITADDIAYLSRVRDKLFAAIKRSLAEDSHCKSYEGRFEIVLPDYFGGEAFSLIHDNHPWILRLHCYVVGPNRHYEWFGDTLSCCIDDADKDISAWIAEEEAGR